MFVLSCDISVTDGMLQYRQQNKETYKLKIKIEITFKEENKMNANINKVNEKELNINEMEQVSGGNFIADIKEYFKKINPEKPRILEPEEEPIIPKLPEF